MSLLARIALRALLLVHLLPLGRAQAGPRFRPFKNTTIIATVGIERGIFGASVTSELGVVVRARSSKEPGGLFWQTGVGVLVGSLRGVLSPSRELCGVEWSLGARGVGHPVYGKRAGLYLADFGISVAKEGGLGIGFAVPVPGWSFLTEGRIPISIYVASPGLCRVSGKVNDGIDRLTSAAGRLAAPVLRPVGRAMQPLVRAARHVAGRLHRRGKPEPPGAPPPAAL